MASTSATRNNNDNNTTVGVSALELNDKIISLPDIQCVICRQILSPPVLLVANIGGALLLFCLFVC